MRSPKLSVVVVVLLSLLASVQSVAQCIASPCEQSSANLPPCHRHQAPTTKSCVNPSFVADARPHPGPQFVLQATVDDAEAVAPAVWQPHLQPHPSSTPHDSAATSLFILRI